MANEKGFLWAGGDAGGCLDLGGLELDLFVWERRLGWVWLGDVTGVWIVWLFFIECDCWLCGWWFLTALYSCLCNESFNENVL